MTEKAFACGMGHLAMVFPNFEMGRERLAFWKNLLEDLDDEQFETGVRLFCQRHPEIFPNTNVPAHIRRYALGAEIPSKAEAWEMVVAEVRRVGGVYGRPEIKSAAVQRSVQCLGWREICCSENPEAVRAHFFKIYESFAGRFGGSVD